MSRESYRTKNAAITFDRLTFASLGGDRISGYALRWTGDARRPLVVHGQGYGGNLEFLWPWAGAYPA